MSFITDLFSSGAETLVDSVGKVLDNVVTTKEERMQLENEIRKSEMQFQIEMRQLSIDERKLIIEDTGNARNREIEVAKSENATKLSKNVTPYLALGTVLLAFVLFYIMIFKPDAISEKSKEIVLYILGILSAILVQVYSYYFGSSSGSAAKDRTISGFRV
jgi:predicted type IV restriction endonuclease